jgi:type I restriction-modification system DNA methylase subunit
MLNGGYKDFCLQTAGNDMQDISSYFSDAWSSNTKNFITIIKDDIRLYNWYDHRKQEVIPLEKINNNPNAFYNYLSSKSYKTSNDVVPFVINIFRQLRNGIHTNDSDEALNLLFKLLISIDKDEYAEKIDVSKWGIKDVNISSAEFDRFVEQIRNGVNSITPNLDLILRHVSGALFQEAHKEVIYFDSQMNLWGEYSGKLITRKDSYSSVHYTPNYLARSIVENCLKQIDLQNRESLKIFDAACGSSEFLIETLKQLQNLKYQGRVKIIGWDSSPSAVSTSNFLLNYEKRTQWDGNLDFEIKQVADSLTEKWDNDYDLIVMNPPYISWELLNKDSREAIVNTFDTYSKLSKPNQASAFFYKAVKSLSQNGVLGCILPTAILTSDSYGKMRNEISEEIAVNLLAKLGNYVFESALTDVSFFVGTKTKSRFNTELVWCKNEKGIVQDVLCDLRKKEFNNLPAVENKSYSIYVPAKFPIVSGDSWKVISSKEERFLKEILLYKENRQLVNVSDIFSVKQGIRTGNNNVFVISIQKYEDLPENEKKYYRKVINNNTIKNGILTLKNYVWYPYNSKGIIIDDESKFQKLAPRSYEQLSMFKNELSSNRARKDINTWWYLSEHRAWLRDKESRLYSTEFGKSDSFAFDKTGDYVVERGCAWIPKSKFDNDDYYFYLAVFSSNLFDFLLSIYSKPILSGYYLGKIYTQNIPIPDINLSEVKESYSYQRLVELGKELEKDNSYVKYTIDDALEHFYPKIHQQ